MNGPRIANAQWIVGLLFAGSAAVLGLWARLPFPYRDDWAWFLWLLGPTPLWSYFHPHNEHVIPLARLLLQVQYMLEGSNGYTLLGVSLACLGVVVFLTLAEIRRRWPADVVARRWASGIALTLLCFAWQLQSLVFPAAVLFPLVEMFAVASVTALLNAGEATGSRRTRWLAVTALGAVGAMLSTTNGLPVPVMLALVAAGRRMAWPVVAGFLLMAGVAGGLYVVFVLLRPAADAPLGPMPSAWMAGAFFLAFYSSVVAQVSAAGGVVAGTILFACGLYAVHTTLRRPDRPRLEYFAAGVLLFTMATAALAAPTRVSFGIVQVAQSRYASFVQPFWAALFLVGASRLVPRRARALAVPALAASVAALGAQAIIGTVWVAKADNVGTAGLALRAGGGDEEWLLTLYPSTPVLREVYAALVADGDRSLGGPLPAISPEVVARAGTCDAHTTLVPVPSGSGLRLHAEVGDGGDHGVILDHAGQTVGLARPAPLANTPNPSPMDVARAVARAARTPSPARPDWIGFGSAGQGGPYLLVILDRDGTPLCRVSATHP